jgi:hypothetical protein
MSSIIVRKSTALVMALLVVVAMSLGLPATTEARQVRNTTRTNVNRNVNVNRDVNVNRNVNRNVNVHRDIDVDVDHHYRGYHPVATAAAVAATATVTAAVVGSMVHCISRSMPERRSPTWWSMHRNTFRVVIGGNA